MPCGDSSCCGNPAPIDPSPAKAAKAARADVYKAIDGERAYQEGKWFGPEDRCTSVGDFLTVLDIYLAKAKAAYTDNHGDAEALHAIRKVAAVAVHALELNGVLPRDGFPG